MQNNAGEIARGNDPRGFVDGEIQQAVLVARHEVLGIASYGQGQQVIVIGIGRALHARQRIDVLPAGELWGLVDQAATVLWGLMTSTILGLCSMARSSSTCVPQVRSVNFPSSQASTIAAGLPAGAIMADTREIAFFHALGTQECAQTQIGCPSRP